jgi:isopenicillin N synthase-like dioxygenase
MTNANSSFTSIPRIDLSSSDQDGLITNLRHALINVGFLYVENHGVPSSVIADMRDALPSLFTLSPEVKSQVALSNSPHFLGYSAEGSETTAGQADRREQFEFANELESTWEAGRPLSERLKGPNPVSPQTCLRDIVEACRMG